LRQTFAGPLLVGLRPHWLPARQSAEVVQPFVHRPIGKPMIWHSPSRHSVDTWHAAPVGLSGTPASTPASTPAATHWFPWHCAGALQLPEQHACPTCPQSGCPESLDSAQTPRKQVEVASVQLVPMQQACPRPPHSTPPSSMRPPSDEAVQWLPVQRCPGRQA
jgi:hypothetical protein